MADDAVDCARWLSDGQVQDWKALVAMVTGLSAALDAQLKRDAGMNLFEYHVLVALSEAPGGVLPMTDLARMAQGSPSRISHAVSRLEGAGWVERVTCYEAGRRTSASLTADGTAKLEATAPGHVREVRRLVVDALTPQEFDELARASRTIVQQATPEVAQVLAEGTLTSG
ncbi:MarR family winged helix-turn-helix transcriptional regulator [Cellulomonas hominis]